LHFEWIFQSQYAPPSTAAAIASGSDASPLIVATVSSAAAVAVVAAASTIAFVVAVVTAATIIPLSCLPGCCSRECNQTSSAGTGWNAKTTIECELPLQTDNAQ
jgi:hypothetical protein